MFNLYTNALVQNALLSQTVQTGTVDGVAIDTAVFGNSFRDVLFAIGSHTLTDGSYAFTVEESDASGSGYAAVDSARVLGSLPTFASTDDDLWKSFGARPTKRYVRLVCTATSATTGGTLYALAVLGSGNLHPVARS